jgi:hypothetical protein
LAALIIVLYILGVILLALIGLCLLFLIIPIRYKLDGGYLEHLWLNFNLRCSPLLVVRGNLKSSPDQALHLQFVLMGIPITLNPEKWEKTDKEKKKKKHHKKKSRSHFLSIIDRDLRIRGMALVGDLLSILKPDKLEITGKIGFDEPHLTGWLAALCHSLKYCCKSTLINIEPSWEEEHYDLNILLEGRIMTGLIMLKVAGFAIGRWYHNTFSSRKENIKLNLN